MKRMVMATLFVEIAAANAAGQTRESSQAGVAPFTVQRTGPASNSRSMILIPGFLSGGEVWKGTVDRFGGEYDMHVLTLAGFAGVALTGADPFLRTTRDAIIQYIRDNKLNRPVLVGHSLGGFMSLWIAATAPELVGPVIAVDGVPFLTALGDTTMTAEKAAAQANMMRTAMSGMSAEALAAQTRMAMMSQVKDTSWHSKGAEWGAAADAKTAGRAIGEMLTTDIRGDVGSIRTPVLLFMAGNGMRAEQQAVALSRYRGQLSAVKDARVVGVPNALHFIMIDDPAFFHTTMFDFLANRAVK